jgi:chemotaxis-related protein WspD
MWTDLLARAKADRRGGGRSVVVFRVGREWFGLNTDCFQSIANIRPIHSLPHLHGRIVLGLANIEGELVLCASLAELLGLETADEPESAADERRQPGGSGRILVLDGPDGRWAAPVDEVWGVYRLPDDQVEAAPATLAKAKTNHVQGLFAIDEHHAAWLDERLVFNSLSRSIR